MNSPYRAPAPRPPSKYGIWHDRSQRSLLVRLGLSEARWGLRAKTTPLHFQERDFEEVLAACVALERERVFADDEVFYMVDRKTGKCFSPPPVILGNLIAQRCPICKAENGERCDVGLHS